MRSASLQYKSLMQRTLKPATQVRFREAIDEGYVATGSPDNVDTALMRGFNTPSVPNYRRFATLDTFGWKVDDASYACAGYESATGNNCFITKPLTGNTDVVIQDNISINTYAGTVYLKVAPIHCSSLTIKFGVTDHQGGFAETPQEVTLDGTTMIEFVTVEFTANNNMYLLVFNVSEACRISYYPLSTNNEDPVAIFDNSNIVSVDIEEFVDLYSQELPRFNVVAKIYDAEGKYDPINPQGEFSKFVQDYSVRMLVGYEVNGFFEAPFDIVLYLNDTPKYEKHEITLSFSTIKSADNKYANTLPTIAGNPGDAVANKTWYARNCSISSSGFESLITKEEINQIVCSIYGEGFVNLPEPLLNIRALYRNGRNLKHFTGYEVIDKNSIKIERKPVLKALTIKQYTNTIPASYQDTISGVFTNSAYKQWSTTDIRPYRAIIDVSVVNYNADYSDVCRVDELELTGATNMAWSFVNYVDPDTGAARLQLYIYCSSYNFSGQSTYELGLSHVKQAVNDVTETVNTDGENMVIDNPFITDSSLLASCSKLVKQTACYRDYYTFDAIADYCTDVGDWIIVDTPYEKGVPLFVTNIKYKMPGGTCTITGNRRFALGDSVYAPTKTYFATFNGVRYTGFTDSALVGYFHTTGGRTDVVLITPASNLYSGRIRVPDIGYDTVDDGNVITISDSMNLTWYTDVADHSIPGEWTTNDCMYLGTFANVKSAAQYLIKKAYKEQGYTVTLEA